MDVEHLDPALLQRLLDAANDGIVVAEQEGDDHILIYANAAFERLTGYTRDEILYQDCRFLQGNDRDQPGISRIRAALKANEPCRVTLRNYRKDGSLFWNELSITPVFNDEDRLTYYIGIQKDVTARVEAEQEIRRLGGRLADEGGHDGS
ncbi:PAS domain-containing protein [Arhodomonas sp. SL1]|uniref:PAS domain-containing protein n=1 Tax=Arhodomonas sp. SL1 TaxID=3425691 RepID=UPI003F88370C